MKSAFLKARHLPTLIACFANFDPGFAVWVVTAPVLAGAVWRTGHGFGFAFLAGLALAASVGIAAVRPRWRRHAALPARVRI